MTGRPRTPGCDYCANLPHRNWCQDGSWNGDRWALGELFMRFCLAHGVNVSAPAALTSLALLALADAANDGAS